ncbi:MULTISPECIES: mannose-6-phosphate isomerase, class I [Curtobacterium]|jgi:mannose-6-phosphate isomerase|uniref:mannose-6-phosphate isomerase n=1 Tax=Curtobacterium poinsettiae TaxID=159612 RepID=A0ABT3S3S8_9MICO|nr:MULTISPECIES: mannose-6-phosphate isomerase, class I [Curtobacterium]MBT1596358.1 mannose-6-phosphate isomerase, class I [Curtobacterium flaccumfaciens pv. flaccumfaciens]MBT1609460.1 mannose-6-phosphate isomerase, class I [Curtobacterium flaccumfaciens pv. poinsettiae]MBT1618869.1 mannose-6-phosphate isomerase, class I [Curtobacterium flaccumfaciens pv. poinsettiae]MCS6565929.1 mannose-6-phosphate isomerase, class I [Curtobacterium flaccumfaciens pv. flaccumfaciens]MCS6578302.1 mannose-6-p
MFLGITNTPRDYAWGSVTAIPELLGRTVTGAPQAELWLGAHAGSPSVVVNPAMVGGADTLRDWIADEPETALGPDRTDLPFLLKVLAAAAPLSLQAHPTPEQAAEGFAREEREGIPLDDPARNYKDPFPKPELVVALSERFEALSGFRPVEETLAEVRVLDAGTGRLGPLEVHLLHGLEDTVRWLETADESALAVVQAASDLAVALDDDLLTPNTATVRDLATSWPGDPGIVVSLLMHRVTLGAGQAMYLPAGNIHAYLDGLGIELMAPSDNVLRGGLTPKHVDVPELLRVLDFTAYPAPVLEPERIAGGVDRFAPDGVGFALLRVDGDGRPAGLSTGGVAPLVGPSIAICTEGVVTLVGAQSATLLRKGESCFITPDEGDVTVEADSSDGITSTVFIATGA